MVPHSGDLSFFLTIFLAILFGMIMAIAILALNLMAYINAFFAKVFLFFESRSTCLLVNKNLMAHRDRNRCVHGLRHRDRYRHASPSSNQGWGHLIPSMRRGV